MDKLVEHGIRMLEIVEGENDFFRNDAKRQADIARAVYDTILRVQVLERKFDKDINVRSKTENSSEKPNNCEHITEDGVTCAKYPACDDCLDNPLNKVKGPERLLKGKDEPTISKMEQVDKPTTQTETQNSNLTFEKADERCKGCNHYKLTCDLFSEICRYQPKDEPTSSKMEQVDKDINVRSKDEPKPCEWCKFYDGENCFSQEPCKVMLYLKAEPQTERSE